MTQLTGFARLHLARASSAGSPSSCTPTASPTGPHLYRIVEPGEITVMLGPPASKSSSLAPSTHRTDPPRRTRQNSAHARTYRLRRRYRLLSPVTRARAQVAGGRRASDSSAALLRQFDAVPIVPPTRRTHEGDTQPDGTGDRWRPGNGRGDFGRTRGSRLPRHRQISLRIPYQDATNATKVTQAIEGALKADRSIDGVFRGERHRTQTDHRQRRPGPVHAPAHP
ncbi:hypothetical protein ACFZCU_43850 [Streptomyces canus]|uniref:hypothetical protein n=1 Tax=Streptomyces canus TaxID=58343 RepID=UPI0036DFF9E9